jgi:thiamine biosynthesis lipoprotein
MYRFRSMNTEMVTYYLTTTDNRQTERWFHNVENALSRFLPGSELSQLNRTRRVPFMASDVLFEAVMTADRFFHETDGLFNPYLGCDLCRIGYDRSFEKIRTGSLVVDDRVFPIPHAPADVNPSMRSITMHGSSIDLGGIGKGWAAQKAADQLRKRRPYGGIAAGGDIIVWGRPKKKWTISISRPESWNKNLCSFELDQSAGVATSSTLGRSWADREGTVYHHILDPRTHLSAHSDLVQISVLAADLCTAEVYAKCLIVLGWEPGLRWAMSKRPELGMIGLKGDGSLVVGGTFRDYAPKGVKTNERMALGNS